MKIGSLVKMIPFSDFSVVEKHAVDAVKYNFVQAKIDHLKGVVQFGSQVCFRCVECVVTYNSIIKLLILEFC